MRTFTHNLPDGRQVVIIITRSKLSRDGTGMLAAYQIVGLGKGFAAVANAEEAPELWYRDRFLRWNWTGPNPLGVELDTDIEGLLRSDLVEEYRRLDRERSIKASTRSRTGEILQGADATARSDIRTGSAREQDRRLGDTDRRGFALFGRRKNDRPNNVGGAYSGATSGTHVALATPPPGSAADRESRAITGETDA